MKFKNVKILYYSPTGTTAKICEEIFRGLELKNVETVNITDKTMRSCKAPQMDESLLILGLPVYSGRIPEETKEYLNKLEGNNSPVVLVAVYGNRHYDDALLEMRDLISKKGFIVVAAAAFIGEHSFSTEKMPIASGRPDVEDLNKARHFGKEVSEILKGISSLSEIGKIEIPGKFPYKDGFTSPNGSPETDPDKCIRCGACARVCPVGAISAKDLSYTDGTLCTFCCACIKACPTGARHLTLQPIIASTKKLFDNCKERKEPETFLPSNL